MEEQVRWLRALCPETKCKLTHPQQGPASDPESMKPIDPLLCVLFQLFQYSGPLSEVPHSPPWAKDASLGEGCLLRYHFSCPGKVGFSSQMSGKNSRGYLSPREMGGGVPRLHKGHMLKEEPVAYCFETPRLRNDWGYALVLPLRAGGP